MEWQCLDTGRRSAVENMAIDQRLLETLDPYGVPILHLYEWEGASATYGYFTNPDHYLHADAVAQCELQLARRPTGGGIIFHTTDFAFSLLIPSGHPEFSLNTLENYAFVNGLVLRAIEAFSGRSVVGELLQKEQREGVGTRSCCNFCMAKPTQYDVMVGGRKVGGAAQRRTKAGYLHQGSIALRIPEKTLLVSVLKEEAVVASMQKNSFCLLEGEAGEREMVEARIELRRLLSEQLIHK